MDATIRKNNALAAYIYLASLALYLIPALYLLVNPSGKISVPFIIILVVGLLLGFLLAVGLQLKAGKTWTKVLVLLRAVGIAFFSMYFIPALLYHSPLTILRTLVFLTLNLGTIFFQFKAHRVATSEAGVAAGGA